MYYYLYLEGVHLQGWPVYGMFQPDSMHVVHVGHEEYIITANEGDIKDYSELPLPATGFSEGIRVHDLTLSGTAVSLYFLEQSIS